ncbi:IclR family transcriptional regulator [Branchiibius cervicis]|uniref:IclR family transcriptional regulator n=1 Tax=Branchiibius cervicis TaxID=908252 RepID=A0ABW2AYD5_9MICO
MAAPAAAHAIAVLQLLARRAEPLPAAAIARALNLPRSSTYRVLSVLKETGFVVHLDEDRRWGLGVAAFELGSAYSRQAPLQRIARPILTRLVDATTHNAHLAVLHGRDVLYVIEERAPRRPSLVTDVGVRLPATVTASGLAMLAALPPAQVRALYPDRDSFAQRNSLGPTSLTQLRSILSTVRQQGVATESDSVTEGFASLAAAVLDHNDFPVAGIALTYPVGQLSDQHKAAIDVRRSAAELSRRLGRRAPT